MQKILLVLISCLILSACGGVSGVSGGGNSPIPPTASQATLPFTPDPVPAGSDTNGAVMNLTDGLLAIPSIATGSSGGYLEIALSSDVIAALNAAISADRPLTINTTQSGQVTIAVKNVDGSSSLYLISPNTQSRKSLSAVSSSAESFTLVADKPSTTNTMPVRLGGFLNEPINAIVYGYNANNKPGLAVVFPNNNALQAQTVYKTLNACSGVSSTLSSTNSQGVDYIGVGTSGASASNVCVASLSNGNIAVTNLSAQAPASKYTSTPVKSFGYPTTLNTGNALVGYWFSQNQIYKVIGSYVNGVPTGSGFLNVTSAQTQVTNAGRTRVTFTNVPAANIIYSTFVDNSGNVWVGTNGGTVFVLRNGYTQWTSVSLGTGVIGGNVTVTNNGTNSGATAVSTAVSGGTAVYNVQ